MMYVGEAPWHGLGTKLDKPATAREAIEAAGLGFTVEKVPLKTEKYERPVTGHFATVRTDTLDVLGVVGSHYVPIQNRESFTMFDPLVGEGEAIYHTAGALGKGERVWILAKLPDYIRINGNDIVEKFLLLSTSHDGSAAVRVKLTPIRVVCENTLAFALSGPEQEAHIRHTANAQEKLKEAHEVLGLTNQLYGQLDQILNRMSKKHIDTNGMGEYVKAVFPLPQGERGRLRTKLIHEKVFELVETGRGAEFARGTLWGAYNSVTEFVDHCRQPNSEESARLKSIWFGSGERVKKEAFRAAVGMLS
jgi:phage/plasmid-like protein (TIGR03299 family)